MYSLLYMTKLKPQLQIENNLSLLRAQKKLTQQNLADQVGVTRATIIAIEKGNYNPSLELAFRLARIFATDIQSIFSVGAKHEKNYSCSHHNNIHFSCCCTFQSC